MKEFEDMGFKMTTNPTALLCPVTQTLKQVLTNFRDKGESACRGKR